VAASQLRFFAGKEKGENLAICAQQTNSCHALTGEQKILKLL